MSMTAAFYRVVGFQAGLSWRPLAFEKHPPAIRVCSLCGVAPRTTLVLTCSHALCEPCFAATEGKGRVCPLDGHAYDRDAVGRLQLPPDQ
ncbi:secreted protein, putative, partial [Ixodes scapularis]